ncbi:tyrosine-type recombinase/integrase [Kribbella italica]|uniref:Integrase n=1 Tax=Kribbella italica TaxID=1540520 RepID=A0A7W9MWV3_9ACTN|nr:site-specific integrase [Kribbella italica]MBB5838697.1 integrase [Kribbella italica]
MASIETRSGTRRTSYVVRYRDDTGKQRAKSFDAYKDALAFSNKVEVQIAEGDYIDPKLGRTLFGDFHARWVAARKVSRNRTVTEASQAKCHILPRWANVPLSRIRPLDVDAWVNSIAAGPHTASSALQQFKHCLDDAVRESLIRANPAASTKRPKLPKKRVTTADVLDATELYALVCEMPCQWKALVYLSGWLGWRWSEAMGLRVKDFDFESGVVYIGRETATETSGRIERKEGGKTDASVRTVPLPQPAAIMARWHITYVLDNPRPDGLMFVTATGTTPLRSNFARLLKDRKVKGKLIPGAISRAGLAGRGVNMRQLRHTAVTLMLSMGLDILDVQERIGHAQGSTTLDIYGRVLSMRRKLGTDLMAAAMTENMRTRFTQPRPEISVESAAA